MIITKAPEIHVKLDFINKVDPCIKQIIYLDHNIVNIHLDHPVLGQIVELFHKNTNLGVLTLKSTVLEEAESLEEAEIAVDYYNNLCLNGHETYLAYYHPEIGYYTSTRNY